MHFALIVSMLVTTLPLTGAPSSATTLPASSGVSLIGSGDSTYSPGGARLALAENPPSDPTQLREYYRKKNAERAAAPTPGSGGEEPSPSVSSSTTPHAWAQGALLEDRALNANGPSSGEVVARFFLVGLGAGGGELAGLVLGYLAAGGGYSSSAGAGALVGAVAGALGGTLLFGSFWSPGVTGASAMGSVLGLVVGILGMFVAVPTIGTAGLFVPALCSAIGYTIGYSISVPSPGGRNASTTVRVSPTVMVSARGTGQMGLVAAF